MDDHVPSETLRTDAQEVETLLMECAVILSESANPLSL